MSLPLPCPTFYVQLVLLFRVFLSLYHFWVLLLVRTVSCFYYRKCSAPGLLQVLCMCPAPDPEVSTVPLSLSSLRLILLLYSVTLSWSNHLSKYSAVMGLPYLCSLTALLHIFPLHLIIYQAASDYLSCCHNIVAIRSSSSSCPPHFPTVLHYFISTQFILLLNNFWSSSS